jgi:hypothetical protein
MRVSRTVVLAAAAWVVVVIVGASLNWAVISRAGEDVGNGTGPVLSADATSPPARSAPATSVPTSNDGSTTTPISPRPSSPSTSSAATTSSPTTTSASGPAEQQPVRRSWQGTAGFVLAACTGAAIDLVQAVPNPGFRAELDDTGPDKIRVEFESMDDERRTRVYAVCVGGEPSFEVDLDD